jgi:formate hydrogenlyase subunit 3/multisubunit Na+/H+ antiporter MnhD subunit
VYTEPALLAILILVVGGTALLLAGRWLRPRWSAWVALGLGLGAVVPFLFPHGPQERVLFQWLSGTGWAITAAYRFDALAQVTTGIAAIPAALLLLWMGLGAAEEEGAFAPWVLLLLGALIHLVTSADLLLAYATWEVLILVSYLLLTFRRAALPTPGIAEWFLGGQHVAGFTLLFALLGIGQLTGTWQYTQLNPGTVTPLALLLLLVTVWVRTALVPFQGWAMATAESPAPVSTLLFGGWALLPGPTLWLRFLALNADHNPRDVAMIAGCVALLLGSVLALRQESGRRVQAGDTVARLGLVWIALGLDNSLGGAAGLFLLLDLLLSKVVFHLALSGKAPGRSVRQMLFLLGAWQSIGLPPTLGFVGRWLLVMGLIAAGRVVYLPFILLAIPLALAYLWRGWTLLPTGAAPVWNWKTIVSGTITGGIALCCFAGLAAPWLERTLLDPAAQALGWVPGSTVPPALWSARPAMLALSNWLPAWAAMFVLVLGVGSWWSGLWPSLRTRAALGSLPLSPDGEKGALTPERGEQAPAEGPLQEALPVLPRETGWLAWVGRPVLLSRLFGQVTGVLGVALHGLVNFLERHTTYFLLVVLVAAAIVVIALAR